MARPALPGQVRADLEVVVHPVAQAVFVRRTRSRPSGPASDPGRCRTTRSPRRAAATRGTIAAPANSATTPTVASAPAAGGRGDARRRARDGSVSAQATIGAGEQRELGDEADAARAQRGRARDGEQVPPAAARRGRPRRARRPRRSGTGASTGQRAGPVLLQRPQRTASASGSRCSRARACPTAWRRSAGRARPRSSAGAARVGAAPVEARAQRVEREDRRRQEEAGVRVGPDEPAAGPARRARAGAPPRRARARAASARGPGTCTRCGRSTKRGSAAQAASASAGGGGGRVRAPAERDAEEDGERRRARRPSSAAPCPGCRPPGGRARGRSGTARPG